MSKIVDIVHVDLNWDADVKMKSDFGIHQTEGKSNGQRESKQRERNTFTAYEPYVNSFGIAKKCKKQKRKNWSENPMLNMQSNLLVRTPTTFMFLSSFSHSLDLVFLSVIFFFILHKRLPYFHHTLNRWRERSEKERKKKTLCVNYTQRFASFLK